MKLKSMIAMALLLIGVKTMAASGSVASHFTVDAGETKSIRIQPGYIENIQVQAVGRSSHDAMVEVWANGKPKGSLYVPGRDPNYIVTIRESVSSLEFRSVSGGAVYVQNVFANGQSQGSFGPITSGRPMLGYGYSLSGALDVAGQAIQVINELKQQANLSQIETYLMPARKSAARLYAVASANAPSSSKVRNALLDLLAKLNSTQTYIDQTLETDSGFDAITNLMTIKETINSML